MESKNKRLFFAFEIDAPWPTSFPKGRLLQKEGRHLTVAFLGEVDYSLLEPLLSSIPLPSFKVSLAGQFDKIHFLPKRHPRVAAWEISWLDEEGSLLAYVQTLSAWLKEKDFRLSEHNEFLSHVTVSRAPFDYDGWRNSFQKLPVILKNLHLYESLGQLHYKPIWSHHLLPPFEEVEHTADVAFKIHGENVHQIYLHALTALAFKMPRLLEYAKEDTSVTTVDDIIIQLNAIISRADTDVGCMFKAVSLHGEIQDQPDGSLLWEMIVDV